jgi:hypothetical protein
MAHHNADNLNLESMIQDTIIFCKKASAFIFRKPQRGVILCIIYLKVAE